MVAFLPKKLKYLFKCSLGFFLVNFIFGGIIYFVEVNFSASDIIYMNGTVAKLSKYKSSLIQPGCEIVIPSKPESKKMSVAEVMSIGTTSASLATMIASMVNLFK